MCDPKTIDFIAQNFFDAGCGKYFKLKDVLDLKEMYRPHFHMDDSEKMLKFD